MINAPILLVVEWVNYRAKAPEKNEKHSLEALVLEKISSQYFLEKNMNFIKRFSTLFTPLAFLALINANCRSNPITPIDTTKPGSREYVWTVDTLKVRPGDIINMIAMWGSNENDVWAVGHGDVSYNCVWHYDGASWKSYGAQLSSNHYSIFGFAQNDAWMTDAPGGEKIWHFDGASWQQFGSYPKLGQFTLDLVNVWGDTPNNIYATGFYQTMDNHNYVVIIHYDGKDWKYCDIPSFADVSMSRIRRDSETGKYYLSGEYFGNNQDLNKAYEFDGQNQLTEIYSGPVGLGGIVSLINGRVYFSGGKSITRYIKNRFETINDLSSTNINIGEIWGRSEKDIFAQAYEGSKYGIAHFNGTDWKMLFSYDSPTPIYVDNVAVFDSAIYVLMDDLSHTWIAKGKLKPQH